MKVIKFVSIKLFILLLVNLIVFAISFLLLQIMNSMENTYLAYLINSFISSVIFWIYTYRTSKKMKNPEGLTQLQFTLRETAVYLIIVIVVTICSLVENNVTSMIFLFFIPNSFFFYVVSNPILAGLLQLLWYSIIVFMSRFNTQRGSKSWTPYLFSLLSDSYFIQYFWSVRVDTFHFCQF